MSAFDLGDIDSLHFTHEPAYNRDDLEFPMLTGKIELEMQLLFEKAMARQLAEAMGVPVEAMTGSANVEQANLTHEAFLEAVRKIEESKPVLYYILNDEVYDPEKLYRLTLFGDVVWMFHSDMFPIFKEATVGYRLVNYSER